MKVMCVCLIGLLLIVNFVYGEVELTDLPKSLIFAYDSMYSNDDIGDFSLSLYKDTNFYYIYLYGNSKGFKICGNDYRGKTTCLGYPIYVFGEEYGVFYRKASARQVIKCNEADWQWEYDPIEWIFVLNKDTTLHSMNVMGVENPKDIQRIEQLFETFRKSKGKL